MIMGKRYQRGRTGESGKRGYTCISILQPDVAARLRIFSRKTNDPPIRAKEDPSPSPLLPHALERISPSVSFHAATIRRNDDVARLTIPPRNTFSPSSFPYTFLPNLSLPSLALSLDALKNPLRELIFLLFFFFVSSCFVEKYL